MSIYGLSNKLFGISFSLDNKAKTIFALLVMAEKKLKTQVKMLIQAGKANPAPPVGSTLGPHGINLMMFCKDFNDKTGAMQGAIPVVVSIYEDRSFDFILKTPPVAELVKQFAKIQKGAATPNKQKVGTLTMAQVTEIAEKKMPDLNCFEVSSAVKMVLGTAKNMGVAVVD
jgi:large subunit ribosomal protein L11